MKTIDKILDVIHENGETFKSIQEAVSDKYGFVPYSTIRSAVKANKGLDAKLTTNGLGLIIKNRFYREPVNEHTDFDRLSLKDSNGDWRSVEKDVLAKLENNLGDDYNVSIDRKDCCYSIQFNQTCNLLASVYYYDRADSFVIMIYNSTNGETVGGFELHRVKMSGNYSVVKPIIDAFFAGYIA